MSRVAAINVTIGTFSYLAGDSVPDDIAAQASAEGIWADAKPAVKGDAEESSQPVKPSAPASPKRGGKRK